MRSTAYDLTQPDFVSANRYGQMAQQQLAAFKAAYLWPGVGFLVVGLVFGGFMFLMFGGMAAGMYADGSDEWWIGLILMVFPIAFGGGFLFAGLRNLWIWSRANAAGALATAEGRLVWQRNNYRGVIDGARLSLPGAAELPPGAYRFFYLTGINLIASVERLNLSLSPDDTEAEITRALQDALDFTPDDLQSNRELQLSGRQRNGIVFGVVGLLLLLGVLLAIPLIVFATVALSDGGLRSLDRSDTIPLLCFGGIMLAIMAVVVGVIIRGVREALTGKVDSVTGYLTETTEVRGSGKSRHTYYYYVIDGRKFQVTPAAHKASIEGMRYRLFFLPRSGKVVSAEPIRGAGDR